MNKQFNFNTDFQISILAMLVRDPSFLSSHGDMIKPSYFTNIYLSNICSMVYDYYLLYNSIPSKMVMEGLLAEKVKTENLDHALLSNYTNFFYSIYSMDLNELDYISTTVLTFCREQEYWDATQKSYDLIKSEKSREDVIDTISAMWISAINRSYSSSVGLNFKDVAASPWELINSEMSDTVKVPGGISSLNDLMFGGYRKKGLYVFVASPGRGKTTLLVSEACSFLMAGKTVVFYTMEMSEAEIMIKILCNLTGMTIQQICDPAYRQEYENRVGYYLQYEPNIHIKYFERDSFSFSALTSHTSKIKMTSGISPEVAIVDYLDLLLPTKGKRDMMYEDLGQIYSDAKKYASVFDMVTLSGCQPKQEAFSAPVIQMHHMAGSSMKSHIVDGCFSINQTLEQKGMDTPMISIFNAKLRQGKPVTKLINCSIDYARARITELEENSEIIVPTGALG